MARHPVRQQVLVNNFKFFTIICDESPLERDTMAEQSFSVGDTVSCCRLITTTTEQLPVTDSRATAGWYNIVGSFIRDSSSFHSVVFVGKKTESSLPCISVGSVS